MATKVLLAGLETSEKNEFDVYSQNTSISSTNPKNGTYTLVLDYSHIEVGGVFDIASYVEWTGIPSFRNWYTHFQLRLEAAPAIDVYLLQDGHADDDPFLGGTHDVRVWLTTDRKIKVETSSGSTTGTTVLNTGQYYRIELRADKTSEGKIYLRINGSDELNRAIANNAKSRFSYGMRLKSNGGADPAVSFRMDDFALWTSTAGELPPWLNNTLLHYRTGDSPGNYNAYAGVGDVTNKYNNIDDFAPSDGDTTYNHGGSASGERQTHNLANATPSGTLKGLTFYGRFKDMLDADAKPATNKISIRESGVDYETEFVKAPTASYKTEKFGYYKMPSGADLTVAGVNALDVGSFSKGRVTAYDDDTHHTELPTGDGTDDGVWTSSSGADPDVFVDVDEDSREAGWNDAWLESNGVVERQGFTFDTPTLPAQTRLDALAIHAQVGGGGGGTGGTFRLYYKDSVGTYHYGDETASLLGAVGFEKFWQNNPKDGSPWVVGDISAGEFGIEHKTTGTGTHIRLWSFNVDLLLSSELRETSYWVITAHGDAPTEFEVGVTPRSYGYIFGCFLLLLIQLWYSVFIF